MTPTKKVCIVQPYVPRYRVGFFDRLAGELRTAGLDMEVIAGTPTGDQAARSDGTSDHQWLVARTPSRFRIGGATATNLRTRRARRHADVVVVGLAATSLDTYLALLARKSGMGPPVAVWGHVRSYTRNPGRIDEALRRWQMRSADAVLAYTVGGKAHAVAQGVLKERVAVLNNTFDTEELRQQIAIHTPKDKVNEFCSRHGLTQGRTLAFLGGLDASKRIDLFVDVIDRLWLKSPEIKVCVAGLGSEVHLLDRAVARGQCVLVGYADAHTKALLARTCFALLNPGRIGLLAVDSLVLGLPIISTRNSAHAPEVEYLTAGVDVYWAEDSADALSEEVRQLASSARAHEPCTRPFPTLESMVHAFANAVIGLATSGPSPPESRARTRRSRSRRHA